MSRRDFLKRVGVMGAATVGLEAMGFAPFAGAADQTSVGALGPSAQSEAPRASTFSLCAVDTKTGESGVVVASKCLSVGALVPYAEPGVGAIATQATVNPYYGSAGLELLRKNIPAAEVVRRLTAQDIIVTPDNEESRKHYAADDLTDEGSDFLRDAKGQRLIWLSSRMRQLGVVDRQGNPAVFTGARCIPWAGSITGPGFSCQGNTLVSEKVVTDMARAFQAAQADGGSLVAALLAAIQAGEAAGGDKRGKQAAAMLVTRERGHWTGSDRWCDVRVDDHPEPITELTRILKKCGFVK